MIGIVHCIQPCVEAARAGRMAWQGRSQKVRPLFRTYSCLSKHVSRHIIRDSTLLAISLIKLRASCALTSNPLTHHPLLSPAERLTSVHPNLTTLLLSPISRPPSSSSQDGDSGHCTYNNQANLTSTSRHHPHLTRQVKYGLSHGLRGQLQDCR